MYNIFPWRYIQTINASFPFTKGCLHITSLYTLISSQVYNDFKPWPAQNPLYTSKAFKVYNGHQGLAYAPWKHRPLTYNSITTMANDHDIVSMPMPSTWQSAWKQQNDIIWNNTDLTYDCCWDIHTQNGIKTLQSSCIRLPSIGRLDDDMPINILAVIITVWPLIRAAVYILCS